jgi:DNA-binding response OmpR family regulator
MRSRVLIVEDNIDTARLMEKVLRLDHDVVICHDAEKGARHLLSGEVFNLVICDINLPGRDGISFFEDMKLMGNGLEKRFVFTTAAPVSTVSKTGAVYLQKPFRFAELKALVAAQIEIHSANDRGEDGVSDAVKTKVEEDVNTDDLALDDLEDVHFDGIDF